MEYDISEFEKLPPEIQEYILSQNPELITSYTKINPYMKNITSRIYLKELCDKNVSYNELKNFLINNPTKFGVYDLSITNIKIFDRIRSSDIYFKTTNYINLINIEFDYQNIKLFKPTYINTTNIFAVADLNIISDFNGIQFINDILNKNLNNTIQSTYISPSLCYSQLDLLSQYRIYKNRLGCIQRNPNYAKEKILKQLDSTYNFYLYNKNIISLLATHAYMDLQASVLNIYPPPIGISINNIIFKLDGSIVFIGSENNITDVEARKLFDDIKLKIINLDTDIKKLYLEIRNNFCNIDNTCNI